MRFVLNRVVFLFVKDVSDLWYNYYFLFLAVGKLWNQQEDKASRQRWNIKAAVRVHNDKQSRRDEKTGRASWQSRELEDPVDIIKKYEEILRTKRKGIISVAFHQGKVFKRFKGKEKFMHMVGKLKIHKNTIIFKINLFKLIEKHPKLMKSSVTLMFLKNYFKYIKQICKEIQANLNKQKSAV